MPIGGRLFGRSFSSVASTSNALLSRFSVGITDVLKLRGPLEVDGVIGLNAPSQQGGRNRNLNIRGDVHLRRKSGPLEDAVVFGFGDEDAIYDVTFTYTDSPQSFVISASSLEMTLDTPGSTLRIGDDSAAIRINPSGSAPGVGIGAVGVPVSELQVNGEVAIKDAITAPATLSGFASVYVDTADGDAKIKFGDGTVIVLAAGGSTATTVEIDRRYALLVS